VLFAGEGHEDDGDLVTSRRAAAAAVAPHLRGTGEPREGEGERESMRGNKRPPGPQ
jgi:hypothetical protein